MEVKKISPEVLLRVCCQVWLITCHRGKSRIRIPFKCDSPECRRFMEMKLFLLPGDSIEFLSKILKLEFRDPVVLLDPLAERSEESLKICSWRKKIFLSKAGWVEIEEAIRVMDLFAGPQFPQLTHRICPAFLYSGRKRFA